MSREVMMVVTIGYDDYVMPMSDAMKLLEIMSRAERYTTRMVEGKYCTYVHPHTKEYPCKMITESLYQMAKLAGNPDGDY